MSPSPDSLEELIAGLSQPSAYPDHVTSVQVCQTHISLVFLTDSHVYKVKKPVSLPFLDFSTLELRQKFCQEEVRLNRRLAPDVYLGVVPIYKTSSGLQIGDGKGPIVEWAVKMSRLPDQAMFLARLEHGTLTPEHVERLARRITQFHQAAKLPAADPKAARIYRHGEFAQVASAIRDNLAFARQQVGRSIDSIVYERLQAATEETLQRLKPLINRRVTEGMIRDLHGDLHLDHVYLFDDRPAPADLVIIDCIEFNEAFRWIDVVADMAFCVMDFQFRGRRDLARIFCQSYFEASADTEGRELLPLYTAYRAAVRGKVDGILSMEAEVPAAQRQAAAMRSTAYWLLALGELESTDQRPALVLVSGLPGTGKSTLARGLADSLNFQWIRSDVVRKQLAHADGVAASSTKGDYQSGIYTREWTDRTYAECLRQATEALRRGGRVIVDATFAEDHRRQQFLTCAIQLGVPATWLVCDASPEVVRSRLSQRTNDVSDADWSVHLQAAAAWQPAGTLSQRQMATIDTNGQPSTVLNQAIQVLAGISVGSDCVR